MAVVASTTVTRLRSNARRFASGFTTGQKLGIVSAVVGVIVALVIFTSMTSKPSYALLFTNLQPQDAASITSQLSSNHVPYQLQDGGTTILVPQNDVNQERLAVAAAGLTTQSTVGLSLLDKEGLTSSQLTQQADYLQGLQGELEQTIDSIQGVESSLVNIAMPANQTFALGNDNPTGASVIVDLESGDTLTYTQVESITNLVASAVPGLTADEVTLSDNNGNLLAGPGVNDTGALQNGAEQNYDSTAESQLQSYLTSILGPGNADVSVNALLNFNQEKTSTQSLLTGSGGKLSSFCTSTNTSSTKYTGTGAPANVTVTTVAGNGSYTQTSTDKTCESGTEDQTIVQAPGQVKSLDVAVLVNSKSLPKGLTAAQLKQEIAAAAGIEPSRGDVLSFSEAALKRTSTSAAPAKASTMTALMKPALAFVLILVFLAMLILSSRKARKRALELANSPLPVLDWQPQMLTAPADVDPTDEIPAIPAIPAPKENVIADLVNRSPEEVTVVLRAMLSP